jgi:ribosomal protein S18 acetylase RimI-like enzyme
MLWPAAREEIVRMGGAKVAAIAIQPWFQTLLTESGFENRQQIVLLEWRYQPTAAALSVSKGASETTRLRIRKMTENDLPEVERIDAASFEPLWQNPLETLQRAYAQALYATVVENEKGMIGYQISTGGGQRAHLARLAVHPFVQGQGAGRALLNDLFVHLTNMGISRLSVNTQSDNQVSLSLYQRMGFVRTGEQYPVYTFDIPAYP